MVTKYRNPKKVSVKDYLANEENSGSINPGDNDILIKIS